MGEPDLRGLIIDAVTQVLRPLGYKRNGHTFVRNSFDLHHIVGVQSSQSSSANHLRVTINLGISVPSLAEGEYRIDISSTHWSSRLGQLLPVATDQWWEASGAEDAQITGNAIGVALSRYGLPAFDAIPDTKALLALWQSGRSPGLTSTQRERYVRQLRDAV